MDARPDQPDCPSGNDAPEVAHSAPDAYAAPDATGPEAKHPDLRLKVVREGSGRRPQVLALAELLNLAECTEGKPTI
jgi:hypothetical protein